MIDVNVYQENIFHTKMMLKDLKLDDYLLGVSKDELTPDQQRRIHRQVKREMLEMFYGRNMKRGLRMK